MARFIRCIEGHVFDAEATGQCPMCGAVVEVVARPVEAPPSTAAPVAPSTAAVPPAAHGRSVFLAIAVLGVGLGLAAAAAVIWLRPGAAPPPSTQATQVAAKDDGKRKPETEKTEAKTEATPANTEVAAKDDGTRKLEIEKTEAKTEARPANNSAEKPAPSEPLPQSQPSPAPPSPSTNTNAATLPTSAAPAPPSAPPTTTVAAPLPTPAAPTPGPSVPTMATPVSAPLPSTSAAAPTSSVLSAPAPALPSSTTVAPALSMPAAPTGQPTQPASVSPQPNTQVALLHEGAPAPQVTPPVPGSPAPTNSSSPQADLAPIGPQTNLQPFAPQSLQPLPPSSFGAPPSAPGGPVGGHAFRAAFDEVLGKLTALGPVQPDIANIATALVGHELLFHEAEETGLEMLQQAAAANIPFAAADLGVHYFNGSRTTRRDFEQARRWLDVATLADIPVANYELAVMYIQGFGVKRDPKLSGHYLLAAYHGGFPAAVEIVTNARAGHRRERELMREIGLDPVAIGMTITEYYDARHASDPQGARAAIEQLAHGLQWPASRILGVAQWRGDDGPVDRPAAVKNFLTAARGGDFGMLTPIAEASLDGTLGPPNPVQAGVVATLLLLYGVNTPAQDIDRLRRVSQNALDKAGPEQRALLIRFKDLLSEIAPAQPQANTSGQPVAGR